MKYPFLESRPLSWSAVSSFEWSPDQWYCRYILGRKGETSPEMEFGKVVGERIAADPLYLPHVPRHAIFEHELRCSLGEIPLIGFMDSYKPTDGILEYKTGRAAWTQARADGTDPKKWGQIDMYLLMHYQIEKVRPEDVDVQVVWLPTQIEEDVVSFVDDTNAVIFSTKRTTAQILQFASRITRTCDQMLAYAISRGAYPQTRLAVKRAVN